MSTLYEGFTNEALLHTSLGAVGFTVVHFTILFPCDSISWALDHNGIFSWSFNYMINFMQPLNQGNCLLLQLDQSKYLTFLSWSPTKSKKRLSFQFPIFSVHVASLFQIDKTKLYVPLLPHCICDIICKQGSCFLLLLVHDHTIFLWLNCNLFY